MIFIVDVQYQGVNALAAGLLFDNWADSSVKRALTKSIEGVPPYEPGAFYKRELPCILALLEDLNCPVDAIVIDGFVTLGESQKDGLGMHLYNALNAKTPIIGVAKKAFIGTPKHCEIYRGKSHNPLFVTSVGIQNEKAKQHILAMHGQFRLPTLLKRVDQLCRGIK